MSWQTSMTNEFPEAVPQDRFVAQSHEKLKKHGFLAENTIAFASVCRDEITLSLVEDIEKTW